MAERSGRALSGNNQSRRHKGKATSLRSLIHICNELRIRVGAAHVAMHSTLLHCASTIAWSGASKLSQDSNGQSKRGQASRPRARLQNSRIQAQNLHSRHRDHLPCSRCDAANPKALTGGGVGAPSRHRGDGIGETPSFRIPISFGRRPRRQGKKERLFF